MQIFKSNQFFYGLTIPEPESMEPLPHKLPRGDAQTIDFLQVSIQNIPNSPKHLWHFKNTSKYDKVIFQKCLDTNPEKRWSASELLNHNYFQGFTFRVPPDDSGNTSPFQQRKRVSRYKSNVVQQAKLWSVVRSMMIRSLPAASHSFWNLLCKYFYNCRHLAVIICRTFLRAVKVTLRPTEALAAALSPFSINLINNKLPAKPTISHRYEDAIIVQTTLLYGWPAVALKLIMAVLWSNNLYKAN